MLIGPEKGEEKVPETCSSMGLDMSGLVSQVVASKFEYETSLSNMYDAITGISAVDLSSSSGLPCFDTWYLPTGGDVTLCFTQFSDSFAYVGHGILLIATLSALSIVFRS